MNKFAYRVCLLLALLGCVFAPALSRTASKLKIETPLSPPLSADMLGDWREGVSWRTTDNKELRICTTTLPTNHRFYTLMHDPQYRLSIAWQNVAYNQPPHTGFHLGEGMKAPPRPALVLTRAKK